MKKRSSFWLMSCAFPLLTACNAGSSSGVREVSTDTAAAVKDFQPAVDTVSPHTSGPSDGFAGPLLIRSADLNVSVTDLHQSAQKIRGWLENQGGYYSEWVQAREGDTVGVSLTAKVPAARFEPFKDSVETLGNVQFESIDASDVTDTYQGNRGRAAVSEKVGSAYKAIGEKAPKSVDALTAEARADEALRSEEESKESIATLHRQIAAGTLRIRLAMFSPVAPMRKPPYGRRLVENLGDGGAAVGSVLLFFAEIWPLVILIGLSGLALLVYKGRNRQNPPG